MGLCVGSRQGHLRYDAATPATAYLNLWRTGISRTAGERHLMDILNRTKLCGCLLDSDSKFEYLGPVSMRLAWVFGHDALERFLGQDACGVAMLLGLPRSFIEQHLSEGGSFKLAIFPESEKVECLPATYSNIATLVSRVYPEVGAKVLQQMKEISTMSFADMDALAGYQSSKKQPTFLEMMQEGENKPATLMEITPLRQFLWDELGLFDPLAETSVTQPEDGQPGVMEFLTENKPLSEIPGLALIDLQIQ